MNNKGKYINILKMRIALINILILESISMSTPVPMKELIILEDYTLEMWILVPSSVNKPQIIAEKGGQFILSVTSTSGEKGVNFKFSSGESIENVLGEISEDVGEWIHLSIANCERLTEGILMTQNGGGRIPGWKQGGIIRSMFALGTPLTAQADSDHFQGTLLQVRLWSQYKGEGSLTRDRHLLLHPYSFALTHIWNPKHSTRVLATTHLPKLRASIYINIYIYI